MREGFYAILCSIEHGDLDANSTRSTPAFSHSKDSALACR